MLLSNSENPQKPYGILLKNLLVLETNFATAENEAVLPLYALFSPGIEKALHRPQGADSSICFRIQRQAILNRFRQSMNVGYVTVVVPHEQLDAGQEIPFPIAEPIGHFGLCLERQEIRRALASEVEFVAYSKEKIVGRLEF